VNAGRAPAQAVRHLVGRIPERALDRLAPGDAVRGQVPVPDDFVGRPAYSTKAGLTLAQRRFRQTPFGDVGDDDRDAVRVREHPVELPAAAVALVLGVDARGEGLFEDALELRPGEFGELAPE